MIMHIISEPGYVNSPWHSQTLSGILENKSKNTELVFVADSDFEHEKINPDDVLLIIGTDFCWLDMTINTGRHYFGSKIIVLSNCDYKFKNDDFSLVCFDIPGEIKTIRNYLAKCSKKQIALYGINPKSSSDLLRMESFLKQGGKSDDMYINATSLSDCYEKFRKNENKYDAVICVNDYAAISLVKNIKSRDIFIASCGDTLLATKTTPSITNLDGCFKEFGKACCQICNLLLKNPNAAAVTIKLKSHIVPRQTTDFIPAEPVSEDLPILTKKADDNYYKDKEINEMMRIEALLNMCDDTDLLILSKVRTNTSIDATANELFMSVGGIKYRLKNMYEVCKVKSKAEFISLINKYID